MPLFGFLRIMHLTLAVHAAAAIGSKHLARINVGVVRSEEHNGTGDFLWERQSSQQMAGIALVLAFFQ